ncbi:WcaA Glycosyltransferases involved in cell wall biogenesis [Candidatus Nanopelagicaceae bacterium]
MVPARNESGHLQVVIDHILEVAEIEEIIIVEGGSTDDTWDVAQKIGQENPKKVKVFKQVGRGKFDAVLLGARNSLGKYIAIWDADGTVSLQNNSEIIQICVKTELPVMGDRLRGEISPGAMRPLNWIGNWAFAILWAPILGKKPTDMLCGTKILPRELFLELPKDLIQGDPYGDFALIGFARLKGYSVVSHVVDYKARAYGETNIHRWSGGFQLLKATLLVYKEMFVQKKRWNYG